MEQTSDTHESGDHLAADTSVGSLSCTHCGYAISLDAIEDVPRCPACGGERFRRARLFEPTTTDVDVVTAPIQDPSWLDEARTDSTSTRPLLALDRGAGPETFELPEGWTRIGRSQSADVLLDDATVSRRHALVVRTPEGELRALDDRSLNGLFVNGERVEWAPLADGDELEIGRYRLYVLTG